EVESGDSPGSVKLTQSGLGDGYSSAAYGDYTISFKVFPYPKLGQEISPEEYRLWLTVKKAQPKGLLQGHVTIAPIHPVQQPGDDPNDVPPEVYDARKVMVYDQFGQKLISLIDIGHDGNYRQELSPGVYVIDINHAGIDRSSDVPRTIQILPGETVQLNIDIDTGIR
ncbi:MAG: hypothetical protein PHV74_12525, partial [Dehalococcoidia bacterium]|nr:hypothetical protein [Dehalococcoidia bacterium]